MTAIVVVALFGFAAAVSAAAALRTGSAPPADLGVSAVDARDPSLLAAEVTYRVTVKNLSANPAARTRIVITINGAGKFARPPRTTLGSCVRRDDTHAACALGTVGARKRVTVSVALLPSALGGVSLVAAVSSAAPDPRRRNNRAVATTRVLDLNVVEGRGVRSTFGDAGRPVVTTEISARSDPTAGGNPTGTFSIRYDVTTRSPARGSELRGRVVCLTVEGNRAMVVGTIESSNNSAYPPGAAVRMAVTDNGDPGPGQDSEVAYLGGDPPVTCPVDAGQELPLIEGNYVIRDGEP